MDYFTSPFIQALLKLLLAGFCGGLVGLERELRRKPAGLRTTVLICMGATLFMITSRHISGGAPFTDPARLVAQVVAGVGFIWAGVIIQARGAVHGLTTAATIFVVTAIGIAIGDGLFTVAVLMTVLIILVLVPLRRAEGEVRKRRRAYHYTFRTRDRVNALSSVLSLLEKQDIRLEDFALSEAGDGEHEVTLSVVTSLKGNSAILERLPDIGTDVRAKMHEEID